MKLLKVKTARFSRVVEKCGKPQALYSLAKAGCRSSPPIANKEKSRDDNPEERGRNRLRNRRVQTKKRRNVFRFSKVAETVRGQADRWNRLVADARIASLPWRPSERTIAQQVDMQMWHTFARIGPAV